MFGIAFCIADKIYHPFTGEEMSFSKYQFGYLLLIVDIVFIICSVIMINLLELRYEQYSEAFDKRSVEMRDFTVQVHNLPYDHKYGGKDIMLQAYLWEHIEKWVRKAFEDKHIKNANEEKLKQLRVSEPWQIVDVNFWKIDDIEMTLLTQLDGKYRQKRVKLHALNKLRKGEDPKSKEEQIKELKG